MVTITGVNDGDTANETSLSFTPVIVTICGLLQLLRVKVSKGVTVAAVVSLLVNLMVTSLVGCTFTRSNWSSPQMVTITGVNDGDTANETVVISHAISGGGYDALSMTNR
jgi:hypothetical protein